MNKVWTTEDLKTLRTELMVKSDIHDVAATLDRPVEEVKEFARDLGWIEAARSFALAWLGKGSD